ncbi:hypothetical protein [Streptomyces albiflavescens]|uniref:hypothetical protein n=1 Tax=Streptomyces albiflavescens TaxID=1623582 RepID=UPI00166B8D24|nr:hypothetical protein [Streptomyces albiflavescens]
MAALIAALIGLLILTALVYDITRLFGCDEPRRPPLARLRGRRAALEAAELRVVGLRLHHRLDAGAYQQRMSSLSHGRRTPAHPASTMGGRPG